MRHESPVFESHIDTETCAAFGAAKELHSHLQMNTSPSLPSSTEGFVTMESLIKAHLPNWRLVAQEQLDTIEAVDNLWIVQNQNSHSAAMRVARRPVRLYTWTEVKEHSHRWCYSVW